jgi:hypothetical protein
MASSLVLEIFFNSLHESSIHNPVCLDCIKLFSKVLVSLHNSVGVNDPLKVCSRNVNIIYFNFTLRVENVAQLKYFGKTESKLR